MRIHRRASYPRLHPALSALGLAAALGWLAPAQAGMVTSPAVAADRSVGSSGSVGSIEQSGAAQQRAAYIRAVAWGNVDGYEQARQAPQYPDLDWTLDGCSAPKLLTLGYEQVFSGPCAVHDFGYRNLAKITDFADWTETKRNTDRVFLGSMNAVCDAGQVTAKGRLDCREAAQAYYAAVRDFAWPVWLYYGAQAALK